MYCTTAQYEIEQAKFFEHSDAKLWWNVEARAKKKTQKLTVLYYRACQVPSTQHQYPGFKSVPALRTLDAWCCLRSLFFSEYSGRRRGKLGARTS